MNFPTPHLPARVVRGPRGRLTHLDYRVAPNYTGPTRSTDCGRVVPDSWTVAHYTTATAVVLVTCPACLQWAQYHLQREQVDAELAARLGSDWKDKPGHYLAAVDLQTAQQLLVRLQELDDLGETPAEQLTAEQVQLATPGSLSTPDASCPMSQSLNRRAAVRQNAVAASSRFAAAVRNLPAAGRPATC